MLLRNLNNGSIALFHHFADKCEFAGIAVTSKGNVVAFERFFIPYYVPITKQKLLTTNQTEK